MSIFLETATIKGIDKDSLVALLDSLPKLWNKDKSILNVELTSLLHKYGETNELFFAVRHFKTGTGLLIVFVEFQRQLGAAVFEIHGYTLSNRMFGRDQSAEQKMRDIFLGYAGEPFSTLSTISADRMFECPNCKAKYILRTMRISSDGRIECQNCSRLVDFFSNEGEEKGVS
ncbi:MAG: hypothetical protein ACFFDQ_06020 [Candidatus Thorarchaeota archaeon]